MQKDYLLEVLAIAGISTLVSLPIKAKPTNSEVEEINYSTSMPVPSSLFVKINEDDEERENRHNGICSNSSCT